MNFNSLESDWPRSPRVLLVDDDPVNLLLTAMALRERGFDVTEVTSAETALSRLTEIRPDVIALDALMPGMDGFTACRHIRMRSGFESLPVLMLTGLDDEGSITKAYEVGATDFFVKSNQWSLLEGRLRYLLRSARVRQQLERSQARLARAQTLARMGSFEWYPGDRGLRMSPEGLAVLGLPDEPLLSLREVMRSLAPEDRLQLRALLRDEMAQLDVIHTDFTVQLSDGRSVDLQVEAEPEFSPLGQFLGYSGVIQDVTDRRSAESQIRHLANYDDLTGLPNRRQLMWRSERALEQARQSGHGMAVLAINLDRFKLINESLGHSSGDELLMEVAERMRLCVRYGEQGSESGNDMMLGAEFVNRPRIQDTLGRLGGDEFVALLPEVSSERDARRVALRILESLREPILLAGQECFVTASIGIAMYPSDGSSVAELLRHADMALHVVKSQGRNEALRYQAHMADRAPSSLMVESALHKAIERGELRLFYQPKIDLLAGKVCGFEALMRWQRGSQLMPPGEFIPLAEENGLIVPMSEWAMREALRQAKVWQTAWGFDGRIAVNMPTRMFERSDLAAKLLEAAQWQGVNPHSVQFEITETGLMQDLQAVIPALKRLNEMGVQISIDDFGTGYSSLAYLTTLPISELKIDRSFVKDLGVTHESSAVVAAVIALAHTLGLRVVAEGVETLQQMSELHRLGCQEMQGFLFSRPVEPDTGMPALMEGIQQQLARWQSHLRSPMTARAGDLPATSRL